MDNFERECVVCYETGGVFSTHACGHAVHFHCLTSWLHTRGREVPQCPYCRQSVRIAPPDAYDGIALFYFWTRFRRRGCNAVGCPHREFPANRGMCSAHLYPYIDREDLRELMCIVFPHYMLPLSVKKQMLAYMIGMYRAGVTFEESYRRLLAVEVHPDNSALDPHSTEYTHADVHEMSAVLRQLLFAEDLPNAF